MATELEMESRRGSEGAPSILMEADPGSSSQPPRKEWRAVAEHSFRNNGSEEAEHVRLGQSDERTIYEVQERSRPIDVDFCSITIDGGGGLNDGILRQRLQEIARQREELHQMEVELKARAIARSEILEVQNSYESQIKEHVEEASKLKEQLQERQQLILKLEMKLEEKDRELRAVKIDNEAAWAKEDLLREQHKELATFRRERGSSEEERAQHLQKIHDLQEHIQEKESQFLALEEQLRVTKETIIFKDEQLREAQAWIARVQEIDALHSTTNQSLQTELRERTEHFNQYWIAFQRQFADMERHHLHTLQQLQLELAEAREANGISKDGSQVARENSMDNSSYVQNKVNQVNLNDGRASNEDLSLISNGNLDSAPSLISASNAFTKNEHVSGVSVVPSSIMAMSAFIPSGQMAALHPFIMQPQGVPHTVSSSSSPNPQSFVGNFQPATTTSVHHWENEQVPNQNNYPPSIEEQNLLRSDAHYSYQHSAERQVANPDNLNISINPHQMSDHVINGSSDGLQVLESNGNQYHLSQKPEENFNTNLQFHASLGSGPPKQINELKGQDENAMAAINQSQEQVLTSGQQWAASSVAPSAAESLSVSSKNVAECIDDKQTSSLLIPGKAMEPTLLDERSLLACIVRAIPAGSDGRIRISTTLPNRLGKMLAPLHWHDYKKYYGKLDDFVAHHPELFVIEGDFIHLREGAQQVISASTAYAKVAAAAVSSAPYSSLLPSVALTPIAQDNRHKKVPSVDSKPADTIRSTEGAALMNQMESCDRRSRSSKVHNQRPNGVSFNIVQGLAGVKLSSKSKGLQELNGLSSEMRPKHPSVHIADGNGANLDRAALDPSQNKGFSNGRHSFGGKQQGRSSGAGLISRRQN